MKKQLSKIFLIIISSAMFVTGIVIALHQNFNARQAVFNEHDHHLIDLAEEADHNMKGAFDRCELEINSAIQRDSVNQAEREYVLTGDTNALQKMLHEATLLSADYVDRLVAEKSDRLVISSIDSDALRYIQINENADDKFRIYKEESTGKEFLALSIESADYGLTYWVFLNMEHMYKSVIVNSLYDDYRTVFYDADSGLVVFNDGEIPVHLIRTRKEVKEKGDGLYMLLQSQEAGTSQMKSYDFIDETGKALSSRMATIPSTLSENGRFAVGVSVFDGDKIKDMRLTLLRTIFAALLISISVSIALYFLMSTKRREKELDEKIDLLEKEKELTNQLLKQQESLIHHQKLETIGIMTSGIAHEFNNMLAPIMSDSLLILENVPEDSEIFDNGMEIYQTSVRAKELVANISKLSRKSAASEMHVIYPEKLIESAVSLAKSSAKPNIIIETDVKTDKRIYGDESQLSYMLINLCINAIQEMTPDGGILTVSARDDDEFVYFAVSDTGRGIPEYAFPNLFNPFFTTKEAGKGTGLGLPIALRAATDHGGNITAENNPAGGATFTVTIPVYKDSGEREEKSYEG